MSRTNKHRHNHLQSISLLYMHNELGPRKKCPRKSCKGAMVEVRTRYTDHGPINIEWECTMCGKVIKDPKFRKERERYWRQKKKRWQNKKKKGYNRNRRQNETNR